MLLLLLSLLLPLLLIAHFCLKLRNPKSRHFPPGPFLPLQYLRKIPFLSSKLYDQSELKCFKLLREEYGDTFSVHLGNKRVVVTTRDRETLARKVSKRPEEVLGQWRGRRRGITFTNGDDWKMQRKLFQQTMSSSGFSRSTLESNLDHIWPRMKAEMDKEEEEVDFVATFEMLLVEFLICTFCDPKVFTKAAAEKEETADVKLSSDMLETINELRSFRVNWSERELWFRFPWLQRLAPVWSGYKPAYDRLMRSHKELDRLITLHEDDTCTRDNPDFIDLYLDRLKDSSNSNSNISELFKEESGRKCLVTTMDNVLLGGDTIMVGLNAVLYTLAKNPTEQHKMRDELEKVLTEDGKNVFNLLEVDRSKLPYGRAFHMEVQRFFTLNGIGNPHQSPEAIKVDDYIIPANTDVYPNLYHLHHDKEHWGDPERFRPERFLSGGQLVTTDPDWVPFGIGPRFCPAKQFAMDVLLAMTARILKEYNVGFAVSSLPLLKEAKEEEEVRFVGMSLFAPRPFKLKFTKLAKRRAKRRFGRFASFDDAKSFKGK